MNKGNIFLFCQYYPYKGGEQFLFNEAEYYPERVEINIFPLYINETNSSELKSNLKVHTLNSYHKPAVRKIIKWYWKLILEVFLTEIVFSPHRFKYIRHFRIHFFLLVGYLQKACIIRDKLPADQALKLYSYWFDEWATIIHLVKRISRRPHIILCRMHAYDFDEAQVDKGYHLFRSFDLRGFDRVLSVSEYGKRYVYEKYRFSGIEVSRLGVRNKGDNPFIRRERKTIVSCSSLIPLKRVHLIVLLLKEMKQDITWLHFGSGPLENELLEKAATLPPNISFSFMGQVENREIIDYYKEHPVDAFINVSELEGIPVSLMEAISFGIPVIGCNICGVPEIVNDHTGLLIGKEFDIIDTAGEIGIFINGKCADPDFRKGVKSFWHDQYNADRIYPEFINHYLLN